MKETYPPIASRFGNEDGKSDIIQDGWTTEIIYEQLVTHN